MRFPGFFRPLLWLCACGAGLYAACVLLVGCNQASFLYFPTHRAADTSLSPWIVQGQIIGYCRVAEHPRAVWLMMHGNGGQADGRAYMLPCLSPHDSLYVLEYPGYGLRPGQPSKETINRAAAEAYAILRRTAGPIPVGVIGESLGSGAASFLGTLPSPPDKIVLIVPFDSLASVAAEHFPLLPVRWLLRDDWDNVAALQRYAGPVVIYGATRDEVIGFAHARNLAAQVRRAKFIVMDSGHNDWSSGDWVHMEP